MPKFHRFFDPTYYLFSGETFPTTPGLTGIIGGATYDRINVTSGGTGVGPGLEKPAPMDDSKGAGVNRYTHFVAFGEDGTSFDTNRGLKALAENSDLVDDLLRTSIPKKTQILGSVGVPLSSLLIGTDVFVGDSAVAPSDLVYLTDTSGHVLYNGTTPVVVTAIDDGTPGNNVIGTGWHTNPTLRVTPPIPAGSYMVVYGARTSTARRLERERDVGWWMHESHSSMHADSAFQAGLDERYRRADGISDPTAVALAGQPGSGARIIRDGQALEVQEPDTRYDLVAWPDPFLAAYKVTRQSMNSVTDLPGYGGLTGFALISKDAMGGDTGGVGTLGNTYADFANFYYRSTTSGDTNLPPDAPALLSGNTVTLSTVGQRFRNGITGRMIVNNNGPAQDLLEVKIAGVTKLYRINGVGTADVNVMNIDGFGGPSWAPGTAATVNLVHVPFRVGHDGVIIHQPPYNNPASGYPIAALSIYADQPTSKALMWGAHGSSSGTVGGGVLRGDGSIFAAQGFFSGDVTIGYALSPHYNLTVHGALTVDDNATLSNALLSGYLKIGNYTASVPPLAAGNAGIAGGLGVMGESTLYDKLELIKSYDPAHPGLLVHGFAHFNSPSTFDAPVSIDSILNLKSGLFLGTSGLHAATSDLYVDILNVFGVTSFGLFIPTIFHQDVTHDGTAVTGGSRLILEGSTTRRTTHATTGTGNVVINASDLPHKVFTNTDAVTASFGLNVIPLLASGEEASFTVNSVNGAVFQIGPEGGWTAEYDHPITTRAPATGRREYRMEVTSGHIYFSSRARGGDIDTQREFVNAIMRPDIVTLPAATSELAAVSAAYRDNFYSLALVVSTAGQAYMHQSHSALPTTVFTNLSAGLNSVQGKMSSRIVYAADIGYLVALTYPAYHAEAVWYFDGSTWASVAPTGMVGAFAMAVAPSTGMPGATDHVYVVSQDGLWDGVPGIPITWTLEYPWSSPQPWGTGLHVTDICIIPNSGGPGSKPCLCTDTGHVALWDGASWLIIAHEAGTHYRSVCFDSVLQAVIAVGDGGHVALIDPYGINAVYHGTGDSFQCVYSYDGILLAVRSGDISGWLGGSMTKSYLSYSTDLGRHWEDLNHLNGINTLTGQSLITSTARGALVCLGKPGEFIGVDSGGSSGFLDIHI